MKTILLQIILSAILFSQSPSLYSQELIAVDQLRAQDHNYVRGMHVGISGKTAVCGDYRWDFSAGSGANVATVFNSGFNSGYIASYDENASLQFLLGLTSSEYGSVQDVYVDDNNAIYASGNYAGVMNLNPLGDTDEITSTGYSALVNSQDPFLAKYDVDGYLVWFLNPIESDEGTGSALLPTPTGSMIWAGTYSGYLKFQFEGQTITYPDPPFSSYDDSFIFEVSAEGEISKHMRAKGGGYFYVDNGCYDNEGNLYLSGFVQGNVLIENTDGDYSISTESANQKFFILQIKPDWTIGWHIISEGESAVGRGVQMNQNGDLVVAGYFSGEETFKSIDNANNISLTSQGERDIFMGKYSTDGVLLEVKSIGGDNDDFLHSMYLDEMDQLYLSGSFEGEMDVNPSGTTLINSGFGAPALFVTKYFSDFSYQWSYYTASGVNFGEDAVALGVVGENLMVAGNFSSTVNFNPFGDASSLTTLGATDGYLVKLTNPNMILSTAGNTQNSFNIFPNPVQGNLNLSLNFTMDIDQIKIYSLMGKTVFEKKVSSSKTESYYSIELPKLSPGMYILSLEGHEKYSQKFIMSDSQ